MFDCGCLVWLFVVLILLVYIAGLYVIAVV